MDAHLKCSYWCSKFLLEVNHPGLPSAAQSSGPCREAKAFALNHIISISYQSSTSTGVLLEFF